MKPPPQPLLRRLTGLGVLAAVLCMAYAGLALKGYRSANHACWLPDRDGLRFSRSAMACQSQFDATRLDGAGLTIVLPLKAARPGGLGLSWIAGLVGEADAGTYAIESWGPHVVLSRTRAHSRRSERPLLTARLGYDTAAVLVISSGREHGTRLYLDQAPVASSPRLIFFDTTAATARLLLGCAPDGKEVWQGEIYGLSLYNRELSPDEVRACVTAWHATHALTPLSGLIARYRLNERRGTIASGGLPLAGPLLLPEKLTILRPQILTISRRSVLTENGTLKLDVIVNFIGFIPFGFLLAGWLSLGRDRAAPAVLCPVCAGSALVSLTIELVQVFIPTRYSQLSDLVLNALGGLAGALLWLALRRVQRTRLSHGARPKEIGSLRA
jgi:VanZ family protein